MSGNSFGQHFVVTTYGESHGRALGCVVDGCPPGLPLAEADIQKDLDRRRPGRSRHTTQRNEPDQVQILSGVFEGQTTGTPIGLAVENKDQRSKDYGDIKDKFRPGHADYTYQRKYGIRDYRGGGRSSARETTMRVAAGAIARKYLRLKLGVEIRGYVAQLGPIELGAPEPDFVDSNPFFCADPARIDELEKFMEQRGGKWRKVRKYLKLKIASAQSVPEAPAVIPTGFTSRTMLGLDEVPELTYLQNETFKEHFGYSPNTEDEIRAHLLAPDASVDDIVMIHDSNEQLVAYCWTETYDRAGSRIGRIGMTGVLPTARKQGLGRAIAELGFNHLVRQKVELIELDVDSVNAPANRIYGSLGFTTTSELNWWERTL